MRRVLSRERPVPRPALFPFHCWSVPAPPVFLSYSRFTAGLVKPAPSPVSLLVVKGPLLCPEPLSLSRFTVGGQFGRDAHLSTLLSGRAGYGPRGVPLSLPVSLLVAVPYVTVSHFLVDYEGIRRLYRGVPVMLLTTRFTVGREMSGKPPTTFRSRNPGISKKG